MSMLIPFWVWILLGIFIGWKAARYFGKKFSFLDKVRKPFRPKKKKKKKKPNAPSHNEEVVQDEDEETGMDRVKAAAKKGAGLLAKPWEMLLGDFDEEDDDE